MDTMRARGWLRHYAGLLAPNGSVAARTALSRDAGLRLRRIGDSLRDRREGRRGGRPVMPALVAAPGGKLHWRDVPCPAPPGPLAAVVHPVAMATCDMDRPIMLGATPFPLPLHLGHECVAEVLAVGEEVRSVRPGQRVVVPFQINCGTCEPCRLGRTASCTGVPPVSMYGFGLAGGQWGGTLADQLAVPFADAMLVPLPDGIDPVAAASVADNVCDGYRHVAPYLPELLDNDPDTEVLIIGGIGRRLIYTPSVPLYAGLVARALGAQHVTLVDGRDWVRDRTERLGMLGLRPAELKRRPPAALVADISADPAGLKLALSHTAPDGICSSAGGLHRTARIPALLCYANNVTIHIGRTHARHLIPEVLDLMTAGRLRPETVTTNVAPLADAPEALREHCGPQAVKTILTA